MKIRMKERRTGSDDNERAIVRVFEAGEEYDLGEDLAGVFLREGWAEKVGPKVEKRSLGDAPENKASAGPFKGKVRE
jgi:hypothetical protein